MKRIFNIALIAALLVSCDNFDNEGITPDNATSGDAIEFYAGDNTKTTYFEDGFGVHWEAGDVVPIVARGYDGTGAEKRTRTFYQASSTGKSTAFELFTEKSKTEMTWSTTVNNVAINEQDIDFFAFHSGYEYTTATPIVTGINIFSSPWQVQSRANDRSHIGNYTVLASNKVTRTAGDTAPVNFDFTNCMSVVELTLKSNTSKLVKNITLTSEEGILGFENAYLCFEDWVGTPDIEEAQTIYPYNGNGSYNSNTPEPTVHKSVSLTITEPAALSAEGTKFYLVVLPGTHNAGDITLTVTANDETAATVTMGDITFEKNTVYRPEVTLNNFEAIVKPQELVLEFDFTNTNQGWKQESNFNNVNINAYEGEKTYLFPDGSSYIFDFSRTPITTYNGSTPKDGGGCALHKDGYLLMYIRYSGAESIGLPAIEGYKLTNVKGTSAAAKVTPTIGISSVAAPAEAQYVSDTYTFVVNNNTNTVNNWDLDINNPVANTVYYFYGTKNGGNNDPRIKNLTLTYKLDE